MSTLIRLYIENKYTLEIQVCKLIKNALSTFLHGKTE